jgi:hypothetical protein
MYLVWCGCVLQMVWVALRLCEAWEAGVQLVTEARLKELEELYSKCYVFLAVVLSSWVENNALSHCEYHVLCVLAPNLQGA